MAKRNINYDREAVITDWKTGKYSSIRKLAAKYRISPSTAHSIVAGVDKSIEQLVDREVSVRQELANMPEHEVLAFEHEVRLRTSHLLFFSNVAIQNVQDAMAAPCSGQADFKHRAETISKGKDVVVGKDPLVAVQQNNSTTVAQNNIPDFLLEMIRPS